MFGTIIDRLVKKHWSDEEVMKYVGAYKSTALSFSSDVEIRRFAASGGTTSALLIHGLHVGFFDGVVVCNTVIENGKVRARFVIAKSADEVLDARGSKYVETAFLREVPPLIHGFAGRLAIVGLPCDLENLSRLAKKDSGISDKIALTIALVCGHNSRKELIDQITAKIERKSGKKLTGYRFRVGRWRGHIEAVFDDGTVMTKPTKIFNDYQNLFFFAERKCLACNDHYGYAADLSVGDVWLFRLKHAAIKPTGVIIRSERGEAIFNHATIAGALSVEEIAIRDIMDGQSRIGPAHYNVTARAKAGRLLGLTLKDTVCEQVSWHTFINAYLAILNMRVSETTIGRKAIFWLPRPFLKLYLFLKKGLETFK